MQSIIRLQRTLFSNTIEVIITKGKKYIGEIIYIDPNDTMMVTPAFEISEESAQTLMDNLWAIGIRPHCKK